MQKIKVIVIGIVAALVMSYIVSEIYARRAYPGDLPDGENSGRSVCIYEDGQYELIDSEDYIKSVLLGIMQDGWNEEMLKTMAVILRTGMYYQMEIQSPENGLINESQLREIRYTTAELKQKWGDKYKSNARRCQTAVSDTRGETIRYEGQIIMPVYHVVSVGHTVSAEELYGYDIPYLRQVDSDADRMAPDFSATVMMSEDRLKKTFDKWIPQGEAEGDDVRVSSATASGFATKIEVFGYEMDSDVFCRQLGLNSTNVHIDRPDDEYRIITVGVGNSLGMSLYGAAILAANGENYREIIQYYYTGVDVVP